MKGHFSRRINKDTQINNKTTITIAIL